MAELDEDLDLPSTKAAGEEDAVQGQMLELDPENADIAENEDGSATITLDNETEEDEEPEFYANLAEELPEDVLSSLSMDLMDQIERDQKARERRDEQYEEGIRRTGLGDDAPGGATFQGASRVVHPVLTKACVDFSARVIKELFPRSGPDSGPVKDQILGEATQQKLEKAKRKTQFMNWQMTQQMPEFRAELEQMLTQVPLAGAQYLKLYWDRRLKRPRPQFIPIDEIYLPFAATSFYSAERKTHVQFITELEFQRRVTSGMYIDIAPPKAELPDQSKSAEANDKIEGRDSDAYNEDGLRDVFEIYTYLEIEEDPQTQGEAAPYVISIDHHTQQVLAIYRNWHHKDTVRQELDWIVEFPFVPWRGAYPIGLIHMIGGLAAASTGALRALLDAAFIANSQTLIKLKGGGKGGQNITIQPTQIQEIEGTPGNDDIRKLIMALPYNQPSPVLFQLLGFLDEQAAGVVQTTFQDLAENNPNMPVGSTLAMIEQGMTVFNAIHARLHDAMGKVLKILHRLNATYLRESEVIVDLGELMVRRDDFEGPVDVVPVSDPNIFSEVQRFAQVQMVAQRAAAMPGLYNMRKVEELILERTKIPDAAKELLLPQPEPQKMNSVNENVAASLGRPIVAFPDQDHLAHLKVHLTFMMSPVLGQLPVIQQTFMPVMLTHIREHVVYWYVSQIDALGSQYAGQDLSKLMDTSDDEVGKMFDQLMADLSDVVVEQANQTFGQLPPIIGQAIQFLKSQQPQMGDPAQAAMMAAQAQMQEVQRKAQADQIKAQTDSQRLQIEQARLQGDQQANLVEIQQRQQQAQIKAGHDEAKLAQDDANQQADRDSKEAMNMADNATAMQIAGMRGVSSGLENGHGLNANPNP
jgi:hypothetical protein